MVYSVGCYASPEVLLFTKDDQMTTTSSEYSLQQGLIVFPYTPQHILGNAYNHEGGYFLQLQ